MIPVSSVGSDFTTIDSNGFVVKMPNGVVSPTNVDLPLSAIIPDLFRQVEASLNAETKWAVDKAARGWTGLGWGQFLSAVNAFVGGPAGLVIGATLQGLLGSTHREVYTVFVDWISHRHQEKDGGSGRAAMRPCRNETEREVAKVQAIRARVMNDFDLSMYRLEFQYPTSLLSSR